MRARRRFSRGRWVLLALFGIGACNAIAGIDDPVVVKSQGERCIHNSDCNEPTPVCLFETCSTRCERDVDCDNGEFCLRTDDGNGCVPTGGGSCSDNVPCPSGSACFDGQCRTDCRGDPSVCLTDQRCDADGACRGTGGGTGGTSGTGGTGGSGTSGNGPGGDGSGGEAGGGGTGGTVTPGDPCDDEGAFKCTAHASTGRFVCEDGVWVTGDSCGNGELCDTASDPDGECVVVPDECRGRVPGAAFCNGRTRTVCGPDLVTIEQIDCDTIQHCTLATGPDCAACLPNEHNCSGDVLEVCNDERTGFDEVETCTDEPCNPEAGACTRLACLTVGERRCTIDYRLEECNANRDGWDLVEQCEMGLCDGVDLECDVCGAGERTCADGETQRECNEDGQDHTDTMCPTARPICTGNGQCVGCTQAEDCMPPSTCYSPACSVATGECQFTRFTTHQECDGGGGYCTAAGDCVECTRAQGQCTAMGACYDATCDGNNQCGNAPKGTSDQCSGGFCNGNGACVVCNNATQCPMVGDCYDRTCSGNPAACGQSPKPARDSCSSGGGRLCNGGGSCVACLVMNDCMQPMNECQEATCINQTSCMTGPKSSGTPCNSNMWKCNGMSMCVRCLTNPDCSGATSLCRNQSCVDPLHLVGWTAANNGVSITKDDLFVKRLPNLMYPATLTGFGAVGTMTGAASSAKLALYADNGAGTGPAGNPLATTSTATPVTLGPAAVTVPTSNSVSMQAGVTYWLAVKTQNDTMLSAVAGTTPGRRYPFASSGIAYGDLFQGFASGLPIGGLAYNANELSIYIRVQDTQ